MATKIVTKNSSTASAVPTTSDLVQGELAVNVADKRLFTEDNTGTVVELGTNPSTIDIDAGTIDGAVIGGATPAAITGSTVTSTGNIVVSGTVDGRDVATDGTKLDGIEASADVTDTTNVTAAGALMDSEVTNLAQVKAFDSSDYATAAQGTTADNALPKSGGAMTGAITTNSTFDGRDVGTDGTKLDGIEAGADVTDTTNVTAAGALMDSEVTNLAQVKAFDSSDYATAAQGTTADNALPKAGGALTGPVTTTSTFDGRDVATDGTKLDGIEASADVTDTANVTAAGAVMDSELTSEASVKALNQGVATTDSPSFVNLTLSGTGSVKVPSGTTAQRDGSPANGMFRYNSTTDEFEGYSDGSWGSIGGGGGGSSNLNIDTMTGDGSDTTLTLSIDPTVENNTQVYIDGVYQNKDTYSVSGTTLTFSTAPPTGSAVEVMTITPTTLNVAADGTITPAKIASGDFYFDTNTLYVDSTNNRVGIGTTSADEALEVSGDVKASGGNFGIYHFGETSDVTKIVGRDGGHGSFPNTMDFFTNSTQSMRIDSSGNLNIYGTDNRPLAITSFATASAGAGWDLDATSGNGVVTVSTGGTERIRIDSSGNLLVGKTSAAGQSTAGIEARGDGVLIATKAGTVQYLNRTGSDGTILNFAKDGSTIGSIGTINNDITVGTGDTGLRFVDSLDAIWAVNSTSGASRDNAIDLGASTVRFDDIYATNGTIQTSDRNEKQDIAELSDAEQRVAVACKGLLRKFRWKDSVAEKGDDARIHFGIIAQDLQAAFEAEGLDAGDYAMFISTTWTDEETNEEKTRMGVRYSELLAFIISAI